MDVLYGFGNPGFATPRITSIFRGDASHVPKVKADHPSPSSSKARQVIVPKYIMGFYGHRQLAVPEGLKQSVEKELKSLVHLVQSVGGALEVLSSVACGSDLLVVETARQLGLPVHLVLPKPVLFDHGSGAVRKDAGFAQDFWDVSAKTFRQDEWDRAWRQIQDAQQGIAGGTLRVVHGSYNEPECYYDTGAQILEASDVFVVAWDGRDAENTGGAAELVERARAERPRRPLIIIDTSTCGSTAEHLAAFARADDEQIQNIQRLNQFLGGHTRGSPSSAQDIQNLLDEVAVTTSQRFRSSVVKSIHCDAIASIIAAAAILVPTDGTSVSRLLLGLAILQMIFVMVALWFTRHRSRGHIHERWLLARFAAEMTRGIRQSIHFFDPLRPRFARRTPAWRRFGLSIALLSEPHGPAEQSNWEHWRDEYAKNRLEEQLAFFRDRQGTAEKRWRRTRALGRWATWLAPFFVAISLAAKTWFVVNPPAAVATFRWHTFTTDLLVRVMPIIVPLVAGFAYGLSATLDLTRRASRYQEIIATLETSLTQLRATKTGTDARRIVQDTEELLLDELVEWRLAEAHGSGH